MIKCSWCKLKANTKAHFLAHHITQRTALLFKTHLFCFSFSLYYLFTNTVQSHWFVFFSFLFMSFQKTMKAEIEQTKSGTQKKSIKQETGIRGHGKRKDKKWQTDKHSAYFVFLLMFVSFILWPGKQPTGDRVNAIVRHTKQPIEETTTTTTTPNHIRIEI